MEYFYIVVMIPLQSSKDLIASSTLGSGGSPNMVQHHRTFKSALFRVRAVEPVSRGFGLVLLLHKPNMQRLLQPTESAIFLAAVLAVNRLHFRLHPDRVHLLNKNMEHA